MMWPALLHAYLQYLCIKQKKMCVKNTYTLLSKGSLHASKPASKQQSVNSMQWCSPRFTGADLNDPSFTRHRRTLSRPHETILCGLIDWLINWLCNSPRVIEGSNPKTTNVNIGVSFCHHGNLTSFAHSFNIPNHYHLETIILIKINTFIRKLEQTFLLWLSFPTPHRTPPLYDMLQKYSQQWLFIPHLFKYLSWFRECACVLNMAKHSRFCILQTLTTLCGPVWPEARSVDFVFIAMQDI
jgi:hypothetical protein